MRIVRFVSGDWGNSRLRLRVVEGTTIKNEIIADCGTLKLKIKKNREQAYHSVLTRYLKKLNAPRDIPIVLSGAVSSSVGWREIPYAKLPFALDGSNAVWKKIDRRIYIISGVCSDVDTMRGEETEALGIVALLGQRMPSDAILILPGTHSKHITISERKIVGIRSYMTGELFEVLSRHTILCYSHLNRQAFLQGVEESRKGELSAGLFRVRTRDIIQKHSKASNSWFLSGLLIASELSSICNSKSHLVLATTQPLLTPYLTAVKALGLEKRLTKVDSNIISVLGQRVLLRQFGHSNAKS